MRTHSFFTNGQMQTPSTYHLGPQEPTPEERLLLMDDDAWEKFIEECALQLKKEGKYQQVIRLGGAGDRGRDVCGYTQHPPVDDSWDLYQAKYYSTALGPGDFAPELAKLLTNIHKNEYSRPRKYYICALRVGPKLHDYVQNPNKMRDWILEIWRKKNGNFGSFSQPLDDALEEFVSKANLSFIRVRTPAELLEIHSRSDKYWERFGVMGLRGPNPAVPTALADGEQVYVDALLSVYEESSGSKVDSESDIPATWVKHFQVQRQLFYSAEGLNRFSRDKLPGAFDDFLDQVELGIGSIVAEPHPTGMDRLRDALSTANSLTISSNPLSARLRGGDLQGSCHHLANQERVNWVDEDE